MNNSKNTELTKQQTNPPKHGQLCTKGQTEKENKKTNERGKKLGMATKLVSVYNL